MKKIVLSCILFLFIIGCKTTKQSETNEKIVVSYKIFELKKSDKPLKYDPSILDFELIYDKNESIFQLIDKLDNNSNTIDTILKYKWYHAPSKEAKKWGVIDSTGHPVIPFTCDAIRVISKDKGIATMLKSTYPLDTGVPRYQYKGIYFFFTINGKEKSKEHPFEMALFGLHYNENDVITMGNEYFLPLEYRKKRN
jgi:hypothetical protein